jgi:hypothetical protein
MVMALPRISFLLVCLALAIAIGLSAWRRSHRTAGPATLSDQEVNAEMRLRAEQAVEVAARVYGATLDYSPGSVEKVETILGEIHDRHRLTPLENSQLTKSSLQWGGYIGEVTKRVRPCRWALDSKAGGEGSLPIVFGDRDESFPIRWCYNRITNGEEDNVWHKFTILVMNRDRPVASEISPEGDAPVSER